MAKVLDPLLRAKERQNSQNSPETKSSAPKSSTQQRVMTREELAMELRGLKSAIENHGQGSEEANQHAERVAEHVKRINPIVTLDKLQSPMTVDQLINQLEHRITIPSTNQKVVYQRPNYSGESIATDDLSQNFDDERQRGEAVEPPKQSGLSQPQFDDPRQKKAFDEQMSQKGSGFQALQKHVQGKQAEQLPEPPESQKTEHVENLYTDESGGTSEPSNTPSWSPMRDFTPIPYESNYGYEGEYQGREYSNPMVSPDALQAYRAMQGGEGIGGQLWSRLAEHGYVPGAMETGGGRVGGFLMQHFPQLAGRLGLAPAAGAAGGGAGVIAAGGAASAGGGGVAAAGGTAFLGISASAWTLIIPIAALLILFVDPLGIFNTSREVVTAEYIPRSVGGGGDGGEDGFAGRVIELEGMCWPIAGPNVSVSETPSGHSARNQPRWGNGLSSGGTGLDISAPSGTEVVLPLPGTVMEANRDNDGYGYHIKIAVNFGTMDEELLNEITNGNEGTMETLQGIGTITLIFAHLESFSDTVSVGASIPQGAVIAKSDHTGNSSGPHLHYEAIGIHISSLLPTTNIAVGTAIPVLCPNGGV